MLKSKSQEHLKILNSEKQKYIENIASRKKRLYKPNLWDNNDKKDKNDNSIANNELEKELLPMDEKKFEKFYQKNLKRLSNKTEEDIDKEIDFKIKKHLLKKIKLSIEFKEKISKKKKNGDLGLGIIQEENKNLLKEMDEKLKKVKNFYEEEIKRLKDEFKKEKDNYDLIIK